MTKKDVTEAHQASGPIQSGDPMRGQLRQLHVLGRLRHAAESERLSGLLQRAFHPVHVSLSGRRLQGRQHHGRDRHAL